MMEKKAQGMSLKVIIIAVIALIVLVVLVLIFTGKTKLFTAQTTSTAQEYSGNKCEVMGTNNKCLAEPECRDQGGSFQRGQFDDCYDNYGVYGCCMM